MTTLQSAGAVVRPNNKLLDKDIISNRTHLQTGFLAAVEAQLLVFYKVASNFNVSTDRPDGSQSTVQDACLVLTYVALIAGISGTMSSMLLVDEFAVVSARAARTGSMMGEKDNDPGRLVGNDWQVLAAFGFRRSTARLLTIHRKLISICTLNVLPLTITECKCSSH